MPPLEVGRLYESKVNAALVLFSRDVQRDVREQIHVQLELKKKSTLLEHSQTFYLLEIQTNQLAEKLHNLFRKTRVKKDTIINLQYSSWIPSNDDKNLINSVNRAKYTNFSKHYCRFYRRFHILIIILLMQHPLRLIKPILIIMQV